jgi:hypothetical protein
MIDPNEWENTVAIQSLLKSEGGITNGSIQSSKPLETEMPCDVGQASLVPDKPVDDPSGCQKDPKSSFSSTSVASEAAPTNGPSTHEPIFGALNDGDVVNTADDGNDSDTPSEVGGAAHKIRLFSSIFQHGRSRSCKKHIDISSQLVGGCFGKLFGKSCKPHTCVPTVFNYLFDIFHLEENIPIFDIYSPLQDPCSFLAGTSQESVPRD